LGQSDYFVNGSEWWKPMHIPEFFEVAIPHFEELRRRLIISIAAVLIAVCISLYLSQFIVLALKFPLNFQINNILADSIEFILGKERITGTTIGFITLLLHSKATIIEEDVTIFKEGPLEAIMAFLNINVAFGILIASPIVLYQIWAFILPALRKEEKRVALPLFLITVAFFVSGALFAYIVVTPVVFQFSASLFPGIDDQWMIGKYVGFVIQLMLGFGIGFELPVIMAFLARIGVIDSNGFRERRRYAVVLIFIASAILTPMDVLSMLLMAIPLLFLYQLGIWFATFVEP